MNRSNCRAAALLLPCLWLAGAAHALTAADLKWDLSYASVLESSPVGADEVLRPWAAAHAKRPIQQRLASWSGEAITASVLLEQPDSHAGDPVALWVVKTRTTGRACTISVKSPDQPCVELDPARAEAFVRQVMALRPDTRGVSGENVVDHDGPGGSARLLNWWAFVSVYLDGRALQRPVPVAELAPLPTPRDPDAGQLQKAIDQLFMTPAQLDERDQALKGEARRIAADAAAQAGDVKALARALDDGAGAPLDLAPLLESAAANRQPAAVDLLLQRGAAIDADESGALRAAVQANDLAMVRHLLARGAKADPPAASQRRNTPPYESALGVAARTHNAAIARLLISHGADVNLAQARPVIAQASHAHDAEMVDLLLAAGAHPDAFAAVEQRTALMVLAQEEGGKPGVPGATTEQIMRRLVAGGADVNFTVGACTSAYSEARHWQRAATMALLVSLGADPAREAACRAQATHHATVARTELDAQEQVALPTRRALKAGDYAALEAIYAGLIAGDQRTPSGLAKRAIFFEQMRRFPVRQRDPAYWARIEPLAVRWREAFPASMAARLFQVDLRLIRTQAVRGDGPWSRVPEAQRDATHQLAAEAVGWLQEARALAANEPEWDRGVLDFMPYAGAATPAQILDEAQRAIRRHPDYLPLVATAAWYLGPDWYGSKALVEQFVREASAAAAPVEKRAMYARAYWFLDDNLTHGRLFLDTGAKWVDMKAGFDDMVKDWPDPWNLNAYAYFACAAGDRAALAALLQRIGDDVVAQVWSNKGVTLYELCKKDLADAAR